MARLTANGRTFEVVLEDNETASGLAGMLPLELRMSELNGNEKYADLPRSLPTDGYVPGEMRPGDVMLYGDDCLVVFYATCRNGYRYTRVGRVADPAGLADALGSGGVTVSLTS